jgi:hypothetical protein
MPPVLTGGKGTAAHPRRGKSKDLPALVRGLTRLPLEYTVVDSLGMLPATDWVPRENQ